MSSTKGSSLKLKGWKWKIIDGEVLFLQKDTPLALGFVFSVVFVIISFYMFKVSTASELICAGVPEQNVLHCHFQKIRPVVHRFGFQENFNFVFSSETTRLRIRQQKTLLDITHVDPKAFPDLLQSFPYLVIKWSHILYPFELVLSNPTNVNVEESEIILAVAYSRFYLKSFQHLIAEVDKALAVADERLLGSSEETVPQINFLYNSIFIPMIWGFIFVLMATSIATNFHQIEFDINIEQQIVVRRQRSLLSANPVYLAFAYDGKSQPYDVQVVERVRKSDGKKIHRVLLYITDDGITADPQAKRNERQGVRRKIIIASFKTLEDAANMKALLDSFACEYKKANNKNKKSKKSKKKD